jgi:DNA modification methylase
MTPKLYKLIFGDCRKVLPKIKRRTIDAIITDPPYPEIDREYGRLTEIEWFHLITFVCDEAQRVLRKKGSALFVLQPNSETIGCMRPWLWDFLAWVCHQWNQIQDVWAWNHTMAPTTHCNRRFGLLRPSVKALVWCGPSDCYRDQEAVLWTPSKTMLAIKSADRALRRLPSGMTVRRGRVADTMRERGGSTPFNLLPISGAGGLKQDKNVHGARTSLDLARWWVRYICPEGGTVLDPFMGSGTIGAAALLEGRRYIGIEQYKPYMAIAKKTLKQAEKAARRTRRRSLLENKAAVDRTRRPLLEGLA